MQRFWEKIKFYFVKRINYKYCEHDKEIFSSRPGVDDSPQHSRSKPGWNMVIIAQGFSDYFYL